MTLVERGDELAALRAHWERAQAGRGGLVVVGRESGGGKSVLVEAFADSLAGTVPVLWGARDGLVLRGLAELPVALGTARSGR